MASKTTKVYWRDDDYHIIGRKEFSDVAEAEAFADENNKQNGGYVYFIDD